VNPTLIGRIETRIFALALIGSIAQLIFSPVLPHTDGAPLGTLYKITFAILITTIILGVVWEFIYHGIQQFRWEKDWPTLFGFLTVINEGAVVWFVVKSGIVPGIPKFEDKVTLPFSTFLVDFLIVWMLTFLFVNGPMRVPFVYWRHRGGRLI
jgi:hypothetical protein